MLIKNINEIKLQSSSNKAFTAIPQGVNILDMGRCELKNRKYFVDFNYVLQDLPNKLY
jgi:hypothetical protein